jgi:putative nucleotidyltransferase with HDIG domain
VLKKIPVELVRPGMFIHELCGSWMDHPFWKTRFALKSDEDLEQLRHSTVQEVWIDTGRGADVDPGANYTDAAEAEHDAESVLMEGASATAVRRPESPTTYDVEIARARGVCQKARKEVVRMFGDVRMGQAIDTESAEQVVDAIQSSIERNASALLSIVRLKEKNAYTYMHSVSVCALMTALATQLGMGDADRRKAGMAGLLHDIGKIGIPDSILDKPGKLTDEEFELVRSHPRIGHEYLARAPAVDPVVLDVALHHHERTDGRGYPDALPIHRISVFARMGAVCDVYDAITSDRPYKAGWDPAESLRKMAEWQKGQFDEDVFKAFVKTVGIYPIGSVVRLDSGLIGVVCEHNAQQLLRPMVRVFYCARRREPVKIERIDVGGMNQKIVGNERVEGLPEGMAKLAQ